MLTKDLLKFSVRKGRIVPTFLDSSDLTLQGLVRVFLKCCVGLSGKPLAEVEQAWAETELANEPCYNGIKKLVLDSVAWEEPKASHQSERFDLLQDAQTFRTETLHATIEEFQEAFADSQITKFSVLRSWLYSDLPESRPMLKFPDMSGVNLLHRYNCALVQGLLMRSRSLTLDVTAATIEERRSLFRSLKFHQLVAEKLGEEDISVPHDKAPLSFRIEGPLSQLDSAVVYGSRLAKFFPRILTLKKWKISAKIDLTPKKQGMLLELTSDLGLISHYKALLSYIPEEVELFIRNFNLISNDWSVSAGQDYLQLGRQSYCFPDLKFSKNGESDVYMELFHRWHKGQFKGRLIAAENRKARNLVLAVHKNLLRDPGIKKETNDSKWFSRQGLIFHDFPSAKSVLAVLSHGQTI